MWIMGHASDAVGDGEPKGPISGQGPRSTKFLMNDWPRARIRVARERLCYQRKAM